MKRRTRAGRRGFSLITSLIFISLLAVVGASLLGLVSTNSRVTLRRKQNAEALNLAQAGADEAVSQLKNNSSYSGFTNRSLGAGAVTITVTTPSGQPNRRVVTSAGSVTDLGQTMSRSVRATLDMGNVP